MIFYLSSYNTQRLRINPEHPSIDSQEAFTYPEQTPCIFHNPSETPMRVELNINGKSSLLSIA
jgi:hypothetical protein